MKRALLHLLLLPVNNNLLFQLSLFVSDFVLPSFISINKTNSVFELLHLNRLMQTTRRYAKSLSVFLALKWYHFLFLFLNFRFALELHLLPSKFHHVFIAILLKTKGGDTIIAASLLLWIQNKLYAV